ncbi:hypothetical protein GGX14DRAFT_581134 [Mycena pura]|uniref:CxC2-like cysteine cluster KDZ transposase-associated domain-containing protein n=1 Tax=Mycena pura TaxID=153505 RepID=A0AAD6Y0J2_9AGAR|nr:hypothetical protein GGX14DRAFT_581134 [Mycena pura]
MSTIRVRGQRKRRGQSRAENLGPAPQPVLAPGVNKFIVNSQQHDGVKMRSEHYASSPTHPDPPNITSAPAVAPATPELPDPGAMHADAPEVTTKEEHEIKRDRVSNMEGFLRSEDIIINAFLDSFYDAHLNEPCQCGSGDPRDVRCLDCLQTDIVCRQCFLRQHRRTPTHWASVWNEHEHFFEKTDISCVRDDSAVYLGHHGEICPKASPREGFTLVDVNGIHATVIRFCECATTQSKFEQLVRAGIFPASTDTPKTGFTFQVLDRWKHYRHQGHLSMWDFIRILQRLTDAWLPDLVPDPSKYFDNVTRFFNYLQTKLSRGQYHGGDEVLPGEPGRAFPHRPPGYLGTCTLDGNFKANLFYKRDNGTDEALTDGRMYFPPQREFEAYAQAYVANPADKDVPCQAHIGSIRTQGRYKYKNTSVSGVVASACCRAVDSGNPVYRFAIVQLAQVNHLRQKNTPPYPPESQPPKTQSYDSYCSWIANQLTRVADLFPEDKWLLDLYKQMQGQIPANHIAGHGRPCQILYQPAYFPCRAHFHGETAEVIWAWLNGFGASMRQMNGGARHDNINFAILRLAKVLGDERREALRLLDRNMQILQQICQQHADKVVEWSKEPRTSKKLVDGTFKSVYQHQMKTAATIDDVLEALSKKEVEQGQTYDAKDRPPTAEWIRWGLDLERLQLKTKAYVKLHTEHPLQATWNTVMDSRDRLNDELQDFRARQTTLFPSWCLSNLNVDEPEKAAVQLPSGLLAENSPMAASLDPALIAQEVQLRIGQANSQIIAAQDATVALSVVKGSRGYDYRAQGGNTRAHQKKEVAQMLRDLEITVYNHARKALLSLGYMKPDATAPFPVMKPSDTIQKETHVFRMRGDSRFVDGSAWSLGLGPNLGRSSIMDNAGHASAAGMDTDVESSEWEDEDEHRVLTGTQANKRAGPRKHSPVKRRKMAKGKAKAEPKTKTPLEEGWIWGENALCVPGQTNKNVEAFKRESERVQFFRAESEMYRWLEQYERKHAELWRTIKRFRRDAELWDKRANFVRSRDVNAMGAVTYARTQAAMWRRLKMAAVKSYKDVNSGAHKHWVQATSFEDLASRIDASRDTIFNWMDEMGMQRAYKLW